MTDITKPKKFIKNFKELMDFWDSMTKEEKEILKCGLEYYQLHLKYPNFIEL